MIFFKNMLDLRWKKNINDGWRFFDLAEGQLVLICEKSNRMVPTIFSIDGFPVAEKQYYNKIQFPFLPEKETTDILQFISKFWDYRLKIELIMSNDRKGLELVKGDNKCVFIPAHVEFDDLYNVLVSKFEAL